MTTAQHSWGPPLPGAGPQRICVCCGARETASSRDPQHPDFHTNVVGRHPEVQEAIEEARAALRVNDDAAVAGAALALRRESEALSMQLSNKVRVRHTVTPPPIAI